MKSSRFLFVTAVVLTTLFGAAAQASPDGYAEKTKSFCDSQGWGTTCMEVGVSESGEHLQLCWCTRSARLETAVAVEEAAMEEEPKSEEAEDVQIMEFFPRFRRGIGSVAR